MNEDEITTASWLSQLFECMLECLGVTTNDVWRNVQPVLRQVALREFLSKLGSHARDVGTHLVPFEQRKLCVRLDSLLLG